MHTRFAHLTLLLPMFVTAAILIMLTPAAPAIAADDHDIYDPARIALVNARRQLEQAILQEQEVVKRTQQLQEQLDDSLQLLVVAKDMDPERRDEIEKIRSQLAELRNDSALCKGNQPSSLQSYDKLLGDVESLIDQY